MPAKELEAVVWCPRCQDAKFEVWRVPLDDNGHYGHVTVPPSMPEQAQKYCLCGTVLERKR